MTGWLVGAVIVNFALLIIVACAQFANERDTEELAQRIDALEKRANT